MNKEAYDNLLRELENGTCVLVTGPEFLLLDKNDDHNTITNLRDFLFSSNTKLQNKQYLSQDGFFYFSKGNSIQDKKTILYEVQDYYKEQQIPEYYNLIARLPFKLIINLSPDDLLSKSLINIGRDHRFFFHKKGGSTMERVYNNETEKIKSENILNGDSLGSPNVNSPWVYNFLGLYSDSESLVFTYDALFEFLYSIFPITNIPSSLRIEIQNARTFLFLGFDYNKWYLKVIFFVLQKICEGTGVEKKAVFNYGNDQEFIKNTVEFYQSQFDLDFFKENTILRLKQISEDCKNLWFAKNEFNLPNDKKVSKILYLSSQPSDKSYLRFDNEMRILQETLKTSISRDKFDLQFRMSITQNEFITNTNEIIPRVLVISLHGSQNDGLLFRGENGESDSLSVNDFVRDIQVLLANKNLNLNLIIFSCCHSSNFANMVSQYIPNCIGIDGPIPEEVMVDFLEGFFQSFFQTNQVSQSVIFGKRFIERKKRTVNYEDNIKYYSKINN